MKTEYKYIRFEKWGNLTNETYWRCYTRKKDLLGTVEWGRFKCWEFVPQAGTAYTTDCLADIIHFIGQIAKEKRSA